MSKIQNIVKIGSTVYAKKENKLYKFIIVEDNPDPILGKITKTSPVGEMLLGKKKNDVVKVETESGVLEYIIDKVE